MKFLDYSPPTRPTLDQQCDALQKGLGRAVQWASAGCLAAEPVLNACLHDQRFDMQFESNRGEWLWGIVKIAGLIRTFRDSIFDALRDVTEERDAYQLCELALQFANDGDEAFVTQLFTFVGQQQVPTSPEIGMGQLIRVGGEKAFRFIARLRGKQLANKGDWEWHDASVVDWAIEQLGEQRVRDVLEESAEPEIRRFAESWQEHLSPPTDSDTQRQTHIQKMRVTSASDVIQAAITQARPYWLRSWGIEAQESDLNIVLTRLWTEQDATVIANLLRVFSNRPLPQFDPRLIEMCHHADEEVRRWASNALEQNAHPLVRDFAVAELHERTTDRLTVDLFIRNYQEGDEQMLLDQLELPDDLNQRHWMLMDLTKVLEQNPSADSLKLGQIIYFHTPCESCRFYAARLLHDRHAIPAWLSDECRLDSNEDCRSLCGPQVDAEDRNSNSSK